LGRTSLLEVVLWTLSPGVVPGDRAVIRHGHDEDTAAVTLQSDQGELEVRRWLIGLIGVGFGLWAWHYARKRGLQHLGQSELKTRWNNVRGISRWGW
jgi:hypothetical protein